MLCAIFATIHIVSFPGDPHGTSCLRMTYGDGDIARCCLSMSVVSFPGDVSTAFHSAQHDTLGVGCKIANLRKNRRCGNCNAYRCALPRATLGFCAFTAQRICTISSSTDKNSCHNFVKLSAWWLAFARVFAVATATPKSEYLP